jgi:hypothetical protein
MSSWRQDHVETLVDKQAHLNQKLEQLSRIRAVLEDMQTKLPQMRTWLETLRQGDLLDTFNPEIFVRMGSIAVYVRSSFASLLSAGQGQQATATPGDNTAAQQAFAAQAFGVYDAAGGLGTHVKLSDFTNQFGVTDKFDTDSWDSGVTSAMASEAWSLFTSPFTTYQRHKFTWRALDLTEELMTTHRSNFEEMAAALNGALTSLDRLSNVLTVGGVGHETSALGQGGVTALTGALDALEGAYDSAGGEGPSAAELRALALPPTEFVDIDLGALTGDTGWGNEWGFPPPDGFGGCSIGAPVTTFTMEAPCPFEEPTPSWQVRPGEDPQPGQTSWVDGASEDQQGEHDPGDQVDFGFDSEP